MRIERIPVERINPAAYNPRVDLQPGDPDYEALRCSIEEFGYIDPCIWNERTGNLVGGHQRFKILLAQGATEVDCSVVNLDDVHEKALNVALNKIGGDWDVEKLRGVLDDIEASGIDLGLTGFSAAEIDDVRLPVDVPPGDTDDEFDVEQELAKVVTPVTQPGDIILLGRHRLMCGDSTKAADVQRLMDGRQAAMICTDPPYNVDYEGATKDALKIANDNMDDASFYQFLLAAYQNMIAVTAPGGAIYVFHADTSGGAFRSAMVAAGWLLKQCIIWVKSQLVLGRQDYQWMHEPILYGWKPGAGHAWYGGRKQATVIQEAAGLIITPEADGFRLTFAAGLNSMVIKVPSYELLFAGTDEDTTIWRVEKPVRNADHPTMKPPELAARAMRNSSRPGEIALDLFGGSGSALIAAEMTGRVCYTMELDPRYCDVIVSRWERFTGQQATRLTDTEVTVGA